MLPTLPPLKMPDVELQNQAKELTELSNQVTITTWDQWKSAQRFLVEIVNPVLGKLNEVFDPQIKMLHEAHKNAIALKKKETDDPQTAYSIVDRKMKDFELADRRRVAEEERKAREERDRQEREAREKRDAEERIRQETNRKAQEAAAKAEEDRRMEEAANAEKRGDLVRANELLNAKPVLPVISMPPPAPMPVPIAPPPVSLQPEKPKTTSARILHKFELLDPVFFTGVNREYMMPDSVQIGKIVRSLGTKAEQIVGGIRVLEDLSYAHKGKKP